jgi:hypothetical protein
MKLGSVLCHIGRCFGITALYITLLYSKKLSMTEGSNHDNICMSSCLLYCIYPFATEVTLYRYAAEAQFFSLMLTTTIHCQ